MSTLIIGLSLSLLLFLMAAGLTIAFGMLGVVNFAHGALYMLGAYTTFQILQWTGNFWIAIALAPVVPALVSILVETLTLRPIYGRDHMSQLLVTYGFVLIVAEAARFVWGADYRQVGAPPLLSGSIPLAGSQIPTYRLFVIVVGLAASALLFLLIDRSTLGMRLRAASADPDMAQALGVNVRAMRTGVFALAAALAGFAGAISAPLLPVELAMGDRIIIDCFIVVTVGGLGNMRGAIIAALLVGMTRAVGFRFGSEWVEVSTFVVMILALLIRPEGLFHRRGRVA